MSKLSKREKGLLVVLIVIIVAVGWFKLFYEPTLAKIANVQSETQWEEDEVLSMLPKVKVLNDMKLALEKMKNDTSIKKIPTYDNKRPLMAELNRVMASVDNYSVSFGLSDKDGYIVNRTVNLSFSTSTYAQARAIIDALAEETYTNQITNVSVGTSNGGSTSISMSLTYFEVGN